MGGEGRLIGLVMYEHHFNDVLESTSVTWFTAFVLPHSAVNAKPMHPVVVPYLWFVTTYGKYDDHWHIKRDSNTFFITSYLSCCWKSMIIFASTIIYMNILWKL